jgi:hypothetical protein
MAEKNLGILGGNGKPARAALVATGRVKAYLMGSGFTVFAQPVIDSIKTSEKIFWKEPLILQVDNTTRGLQPVWVPLCPILATRYGPVNRGLILFELPVNGQLENFYFDAVQQFITRRSGIEVAPA